MQKRRGMKGEAWLRSDQKFAVTGAWVRPQKLVLPPPGTTRPNESVWALYSDGQRSERMAG